MESLSSSNVIRDPRCQVLQELYGLELKSPDIKIALQPLIDKLDTGVQLASVYLKTLQEYRDKLASNPDVTAVMDRLIILCKKDLNLIP